MPEMMSKGRSVVYQKILVAVDASQPSLRALSKAAQLARRFHSEITLLHVVDYPVHYLDRGLVIKDMPVSPEDLIVAGEIVMRQAKEKISLDDISVIEKTVAGKVAEKISEEAKNGFDLIVMGTVGHAPWGGVLIGSATQRVLGRGVCPVLVVK